MNHGGAIVFLHGADMEPETVRATWPAARFVARARVDAGTLPTPIPSVADLPETWGILVSIEDGDASGAAPAITATADDGRVFVAAPATGPGALGDPAATVAAARYWELPPAYIAALAAAAPVP